MFPPLKVTIEIKLYNARYCLRKIRTWKVLLRILLARLRRLANLLPDNLPFVVLILLDSGHQSLALYNY